MGSLFDRLSMFDLSLTEALDDKCWLGIFLAVFRLKASALLSSLRLLF